MSPATKDEYARITECYTRLGYLERSIEEMKHDLKKHIESEKEKHRDISNRRLAIYLTIASILSSTVTTIVIQLISSHL